MTKRLHVHAKTVEEYIMRKSVYNKDTGCIEWLGSSNGYGYGSVRKLKWGNHYKVSLLEDAVKGSK